MSFFDKLKSGMSEAGNKAKVLVEQNRLKLANLAKQSQIEKLYKEIGMYVANQYNQESTIRINELQSQLEAISILKLEIEQNEIEIAQLSEEKECKKCGKDNPIVARICIHCQAEFDIIDGTATSENIYLEEKLKD